MNKKLSQIEEMHEKLKTELETKKGKSKDCLYETTLFVCVIEQLRQLSQNSKGKGDLIFRILIEFFKENENKWLTLIESLIEVIKILEEEQISIIQGIGVIPDNIDLILNKTDPTEEILSEHKKMIRELINVVYNERALRNNAELQCKTLNEELQKWVLHLDTLSGSKRIQEKLREYSMESIKDMFFIPSK